MAEVTLSLGDHGDDALVDIDFALVDQNGNPISSVNSGQTFGVQVNVADIRTAANTAVFAAYLDVLYNSDLINPVPETNGRYDFSVQFAPEFDATVGVGSAIRDGIIDEFGTVVTNISNPDPELIDEPALMATLFFTAGTVTSQTVTQVIGSPADASPFQDTLLFDREIPVDIADIRYNELAITINPVSALQNVALPEDVNNDGFVTPSDALSVINALAASGEGESSRSSPYFTDVNGDFVTTARDALRVINYLARAQSFFASEGEGLADQTQSSPTGNDNADAAITGFSHVASDDDDDDDVLALLADDQTTLG